MKTSNTLQPVVIGILLLSFAIVKLVVVRIDDNLDDSLFDALSSKYNVEIAYEIDEIFALAIARKTDFHLQYPFFEPMDARIVKRYPKILEKALGKYPVEVITKHLNTIYLSNSIACDNYDILGVYNREPQTQKTLDTFFAFWLVQRQIDSRS